MKKVVHEIMDIKTLVPGMMLSTHRVDVGSVEDMERMFKEVKEKHGGKAVDILVSNAGYGKRIVDVWYAPPLEL
jgi:3-oxoacyl-[acyl-carrier protein] reductase